MTPLKKKMRRRIEGARHGLMIQLEPMIGGDAIIELREKGRRKGFTIAAESLYMLLAMREADRLLEERKRARKAKRQAKR